MVSPAQFAAMHGPSWQCTNPGEAAATDPMERFVEDGRFLGAGNDKK